MTAHGVARRIVVPALVAWAAAGAGLAPRAAAQVPSAAPAPSAAAGFTIRLVPEPRVAVGGAGDQVTVGDPFWVTVRAAGPAGSRLLPQSLIEAYRAHPELAVLGSERSDGAWRLRIALFRPGDVLLPPVEARVMTARGDTVLVPVLSDTLRIASVLAPGDTVLADIKPVWRPSGVPWWVGAAIAAALAALLAWLVWRRRRKSAVSVAARPPRDVYLEARRRIAELGAEPADPVAAIAAAGGIGDALREYLADGWRVPARERTTLELLPLLPASLAGERAALGVVLSIADLAKYARVAPARGEVPTLASRALTALDRVEAIRTARAAVAAPAGVAREAS